MSLSDPGTAFDQAGSASCPRCGGTLVYRYGNWMCISFVNPGASGFSDCGWNTARDAAAGKTTLEKCPDCGGKIVYNGNYFCEHWGGDCGWSLPHPAQAKADRELALRLTGENY